MGRDTLEGTVIQAGRGVYRVETEAGVFECAVRGRLRKGASQAIARAGRPGPAESIPRRTAPVLGDRVEVRRLDGQRAVIENVLVSSRRLARRAAGDRDVAQTILAGLDQMVVVLAVRDPRPSFRLLDRFLVVGEAAEVDVVVCMNKVDLGCEDDVEEGLRVYERIGYPVIRTSAETGEGLDELRRSIEGRVSAFVGPSGVGKSSLLNALEPGLSLAVGDISQSTGKGRHTTTRGELHRIVGGLVADTPGLRSLAFWQIEPEDLASHFREMAPYLEGCRFPDCQHVAEPGCAVRRALDAGAIAPSRYDSYLRLLAGSDAR